MKKPPLNNAMKKLTKFLPFLCCIPLLFAGSSLNASTSTCNLPLPPTDLPDPKICFSAVPNCPNYYAKVTLSGVPGGYAVGNGTYNGWCIDFDGDLTSRKKYCGAILESTIPGPSVWNYINYIINHLGWAD
jgi:hypothetical protein